jgi:hypothetical protein
VPDPDRDRVIPLGNLEPAILARFLYKDFVVAWDSMAACSPEPDVGGNLMFARQALSYLELACRTASGRDGAWYLANLSTRLAERDARYFTVLPGTVPLPRPDEMSLPSLPEREPARQLLAAVFDTARNGLGHLGQQIPVNLSDGKIWQISFTGVRPRRSFEEVPSVSRRDGHLSYTVSPKGHVYLTMHPDVLLADLRWATRLAAVFSQYQTPSYLTRPRAPRAKAPASQAKAPPSVSRGHYAFDSAQMIDALIQGGHERRAWVDDG